MSQKIAAVVFWLFTVGACFGQQRIGEIAHSGADGPAVIASGLIKASPNIIIGPGDLLEITVFEVPELGALARVTNTGEITYPILGNLKVMGMTASGLEKTIAEKLRQGNYVRDPRVAVMLREYATQAVSVMGEVHRPGAYPLVGTHTLLDVITAAGGLTQLASNVVAITSMGSNEPVMLRISIQPGESWKNNPEVHAGDRIEVGRGDVIYVVGEVGRPGGFVAESGEPITFLKAMALAQVSNRTASLSKTRILRKTSAGVEQIHVPAKNILAGKADDMVLQNKDVLVIPGSFLKGLASRSAEQVVSSATSATLYAAY